MDLNNGVLKLKASAVTGLNVFITIFQRTPSKVHFDASAHCACPDTRFCRAIRGYITRHWPLPEGWLTVLKGRRCDYQFNNNESISNVTQINLARGAYVYRIALGRNTDFPSKEYRDSNLKEIILTNKKENKSF